MSGEFSHFLWQRRVTLARNVKRLRAERGLTQVAFAERVGLHANTILRLENPEMDSVTLLTMARIAWALGVEVIELLTEENDGDPV